MKVLDFISIIVGIVIIICIPLNTLIKLLLIKSAKQVSLKVTNKSTKEFEVNLTNNVVINTVIDKPKYYLYFGCKHLVVSEEEYNSIQVGENFNVLITIFGKLHSCKLPEFTSIQILVSLFLILFGCYAVPMALMEIF
jgi:hypothetical protein